MMNKTELYDLINLIKERANIREDILEKDYYVCLLLKELVEKQNKEQLQKVA